MSCKYLPVQWAATAYVGLVSFGLNILLARYFGPIRFGEYGVVCATGISICHTLTAFLKSTASEFLAQQVAAAVYCFLVVGTVLEIVALCEKSRQSPFDRIVEKVI